jgi:hypothetical protein
MSDTQKFGLTAGFAALLIGLQSCGTGYDDDDEWRAAGNTRICVDDQDRRVPDQNCDDPRYGRSYGYYYLGRGAPLPYYGDSLRNSRYSAYGSRNAPQGFTTNAPAGTNMTRSAAVSRGGLGSTGRGFGRGG